MFSKLIAFAKSVFSENDGTGSATRVIAGLNATAVIVWVSYLVWRTNTLPDLTSASLFLGAGFSGYAANRVSKCFDKSKTGEQ